MYHSDRIDLDCGEQRASRVRKSTLEGGVRPRGPHPAGSVAQRPLRNRHCFHYTLFKCCPCSGTRMPPYIRTVASTDLQVTPPEAPQVDDDLRKAEHSLTGSVLVTSWLARTGLRTYKRMTAIPQNPRLASIHARVVAKREGAALVSGTGVD